MRYVVDLNGVRSEVLVDGESVTLDGHTAPARVDELEATPVRLRDHRQRGAPRGRPPRGDARAYTLWVDGFRFEVEALDERTSAIRDMTAAVASSRPGRRRSSRRCRA